MIDKLSSQQEMLMSMIIDEWIKVAFDTACINKKRAEAAINLTYEIMDENKPDKIIWFDNPFDATIWAIDYLKDFENQKCFSAVSHRIIWEDEFLDNINADVPPGITQKFKDNFNSIIHNSYFHWLSDSFLANFLNCHLHRHLRHLWGEEEYWTKRKGVYHDIETAEVISMHHIYDLALSSFYHAIGYDRSKFRGYWEAAKYCGLWWAFSDVAVVVPKPSIICLDSEYRLHAEGKPALVYKGFKSYACRGQYIEP